jgi:two-component system, cell cycle sensor histidine kinase and response regulator CckA
MTIKRIKPRLNRRIILYSLLTTILSIGLLGFFWIQSEYSEFLQETRAMQAAYINSYQDLLKTEVNTALSYIEYQKMRIEPRLRNSIQDRVNEAHAIALNIFHRYRGKRTPAEMKEMVKEALRPIRFNEDRGYYFAFNLQGIEELFADRPVMEGKNMLPVQGAQGEYVVRDMLEIVKRDGEGFYQYTWTKPNQDGHFPKIAFVKFFEPFGWVFGTGEYLDDVQSDVQNEVIDFIEKIRFGEDRYVFVGQWDGVSLTRPAKGRNMWDVTDSHGKKIVQEMIRLAKEGGGYLEYVMPKLEDKRPAPKLSYVVGLPEWKWYVGTGIYIDEIETAVEQKKMEVERKILDNLVKIALVLCGVIGIVFLVSFFVSRKARQNLEVFTDFFKTASFELGSINPDEMNYAELQNLAYSVNEMVEARNRAEQESIRAHEILKTILEKSPFGVVVIGKDRKVRWANHYICALAGMENASDLCGKECGGCLCPAEQNACPILDRHQVIDNSERILRRSDGLEIPILKTVIEIEMNGEPVLLETFVDITERKQVEQDLRASEFRFRAFFDSNPEGVILMDSDGKITGANKALAKMGGFTVQEIVNRHFKEFIPAGYHDIAQSIFIAIKADVTPDEPAEMFYLRKDGCKLPIAIKGWHITDENSNTVSLGVFVRDLTIEKHLAEEKATIEKQLQQTLKMEAIGTLAGGIAHDFNNILVGIIGYTELTMTKEGTPLDEKRMLYLSRVLAAGKRAKDLVQQILRFSRQESSAMSPVSITPIIKESIKLLRSTFPATIKIQVNIQVTSDKIFGDPTQIHQVMMNLCTNAYHAMRARGGTLTISLENIVLHTPKEFMTLKAPPGDYIKLGISDTGQGISPLILERIFEPYFTTKKVNEGTGLGLSVIMGIIKGHNGLITVESELDRGTRFEVYFPVAHTITGETATPLQTAPKGNQEKILIVDDEPYFLEVVKENLESLNYRVIANRSSLKTLEIFKENPKGFDLVITDQTMPEMTGLQLVAAIRNFNSDIPIILCTGYSEMVSEQSARYYSINKFLMKPVIFPDLALAVHEVLHSRR